MELPATAAHWLCSTSLPLRTDAAPTPPLHTITSSQQTPPHHRPAHRNGTFVTRPGGLVVVRRLSFIFLHWFFGREVGRVPRDEVVVVGRQSDAVVCLCGAGIETGCFVERAWLLQYGTQLPTSKSARLPVGSGIICPFFIRCLGPREQLHLTIQNEYPKP